MRSKKKLVLVVAGACGLILLALICLSRDVQPGIPISFGFHGYRESLRERRAVVGLTNNTAAPLRCQGTLGIRRGAFEIETRFDFWLPAKGVSEVGVSAAPGKGPAQLCCKVTSLTCARPAWVARVGQVLAPLRIHLYYVSPLPAAFPKVHFGSTPPPGATLGLASYPLTAYLAAP